MARVIKTIRTFYSDVVLCEEIVQKGLETTLNDIGWKNVLQVISCCDEKGRYCYTIIYMEGD